MAIVKVLPKFQVVISKEFRESMGIKVGRNMNLVDLLAWLSYFANDAIAKFF